MNTAYRVNVPRSTRLPVPPASERPGPSDAGWLVRYSVRGLLELIAARIAFARLDARDIPKLNRIAAEAAREGGTCQPAHIARIAYVLPRISKRLPWRSDCLVQALAARRWLLSAGQASTIVIGVQSPADVDFGAHAWLEHQGEVVTGGDTERYFVILDGEHR